MISGTCLGGGRKGGRESKKLDTGEREKTGRAEVANQQYSAGQRREHAGPSCLLLIHPIMGQNQSL